MFFWIYDQSTWAMALLFSAAFAVFGIAGLMVFRRTTYNWFHRSESTNELVGFAMSSFALLYGLLLGLLAVAAYGSYTATGDGVTKEAASLSALYRDVSGLPEPKRSELQAILRSYTREVIDVSWPLQQQGIPDIPWAVVLLGALVNIVLLWMIKTESHVHIIITGALSAFMGLVIFLIAAMDYPFRGDVSIDAAPFEQVYTMVMTPEQTAS